MNTHYDDCGTCQGAHMEEKRMEAPKVANLLVLLVGPAHDDDVIEIARRANTSRIVLKGLLFFLIQIVAGTSVWFLKPLLEFEMIIFAGLVLAAIKAVILPKEEHAPDSPVWVAILANLCLGVIVGELLHFWTLEWSTVAEVLESWLAALGAIALLGYSLHALKQDLTYLKCRNEYLGKHNEWAAAWAISFSLFYAPVRLIFPLIACLKAALFGISFLVVTGQERLNRYYEEREQKNEEKKAA